jgi:hypothetical protein
MFQNGTSSWGGRRKLPNAFTEQGIAMLSSILNSDLAIMLILDYLKSLEAKEQQEKSIKERKRIGFKIQKEHTQDPV